MLIRFAVHVFRERLSGYMCAAFPFGFKDGVQDLIVLVPYHGLSVLFSIETATEPFFLYIL